jgi:hypothetical protein
MNIAGGTKDGRRSYEEGKDDGRPKKKRSEGSPEKK